MLRSTQYPFDVGEAGDGLYYVNASYGSHYTFCSYYKLCTNDFSNEAYVKGRALRANAGLINKFTGIGVDRIAEARRGRRHATFNEVVHLRERYMNYALAGVSKNSSTSASQYYYTRLSPVAIVVGHTNSHEFSGLQFAQARAWGAMQPRFEGTVSLINFIAELGEALDPLKMGINAAKTLRRFFRSRKFRRDVRNYDPTKPLADSYLCYTFGVKPMIDDIWSLIGLVKDKVDQKLAEFQQNGVDMNTRHYSEMQWECVSDSYPTRTVTAGIFRSSKFTATLDYRYEYNLRSFYEAMLKYYGLELSAKALWEATPWSFVVDYFLKVGDAITYSDRDPHLVLDVARYGESLKTQYHSGHYAVLDRQTWGLNINGVLHTSGPVPITGYNSCLYSRYPATPYKGIVVPRVSAKLNTTQKLNLVALARGFF